LPPPRPALGRQAGSIVFKDGSTVLGTVGLTGGSASISLSFLIVGTHSITATYGGDANFAAAMQR